MHAREYLAVTFCGIIHYQTEYVLHVCKFVITLDTYFKWSPSLVSLCEHMEGKIKRFLHALSFKSGLLYLSFETVCQNFDGMSTLG